MTKQVTATFTVEVRGFWRVGAVDLKLGTKTHQVPVFDEDGKVVAWFGSDKDAKSAVTDHNRTTRIRAKQREHRKSDAQEAHNEHKEG